MDIFLHLNNLLFILRIKALEIDDRVRFLEGWFADTLASPGNPAQPTPDAIRALGPDTTWQYRFAHPGKGHRAAIIGAYGSSLYVDFDHGTVVAVFASHAQRHSPLLMASLRSLWDAAIRTKE